MRLFLLSLLLIILKTYLCNRVYFSGCGSKGFSCLTKSNRFDITYECPPNITSTIYINDWRCPINAESFKIHNCSKLVISFSCSGEIRTLSKLTISNIKNLVISNSYYYSQNPPTVIFENITYLESIPAHTFMQVNPNNNKAGCSIPKLPLANILFRQVNIGTIESKAFTNLRAMRTFSWSKVKCGRIQNNAIEVSMDKQGGFSLSKSLLEVVEQLGFQIVAKTVNIVNNKFIDILPSAINGTVETLNFLNNSVNNLQSNAISMLCEKANIKYNRFQYLKAGSLESISPGLISDSGRNFGTLKFFYDFSYNYINFLDAGSLHPDVQAYENVASEMTFANNALYCSCETLAWLFSDMGHGYNTPIIKGFYSLILDSEYMNTCSYSCSLPIYRMRELIKNGVCNETVSIQSLCTTSTSTTTTTSTEISLIMKKEIGKYTNFTEEDFMKMNPFPVIAGSEKLSVSVSFGVFSVLILNAL